MRTTFISTFLLAALPALALASASPNLSPLERRSHSPVEHSRFAKRAAPKCPKGYKFQTIKDDFKGSKLGSLWTLDAGSKSNLQFQKGGGLRIRISEKSDNVVIASKLKFLPGSTFVAKFKPTNAPGIVTPFIFKGGDNSDEVDLELVGKDPKSIQSVIWHKAKPAVRLQYNTSGLALPGKKQLNTQTDVHTYQLSWKEDSVKLWVDGEVLRTHKRGKNEKWALDPLNFKFGPWASNSPDWAGKLNWKKNPTSDLLIKSVAVAGCAK